MLKRSCFRRRDLKQSLPCIQGHLPLTQPETRAWSPGLGNQEGLHCWQRSTRAKPGKTWHITGKTAQLCLGDLTQQLNSETFNTVISANSIILTLDKILGLIKFSGITLLGNHMSCKEYFLFSNIGLRSCLSLTVSSSSVDLPFQFPCYWLGS